MDLKLLNILEEVKSDSRLTVEGGKLKLWHYSDVEITDGAISTKGKQGLRSRGEFQEWGKERAFFYAVEDGYKYDKGVSSKYKYVVYIPVSKIYNMSENPNKYKGSLGDMHKQSVRDGYTAWMYNLGANRKAPIVISFKDVKIAEAYEPAKGGGYKPLGEEETDYIVGRIVKDDEEWFIYQRDGYAKNLTNTYLSQEEDPREAMDSYQEDLPVYMHKEAQIDPKYVSAYKKGFK